MPPRLMLRFTKTDLERCARLAVLGTLQKNSDPELAIAKAVISIAEESPGYYEAPGIEDLVRQLKKIEGTHQLLEGW